MFTQDMKELVGRDAAATRASPKVSVAAAEGSLAQGTPSNVDKNKKVRPDLNGQRAKNGIVMRPRAL